MRERREDRGEGEEREKRGEMRGEERVDKKGKEIK